MDSHQISIILVFHNQRELAEQVLSTLYNPVPKDMKLFIIDNASTDDTADSIRSVVDFFGHEETYFYEIEEFKEVESILEEIFPVLETPYFWIPPISSDTTLKSLFGNIPGWTQLASFARTMRDLGQMLPDEDVKSVFPETQNRPPSVKPSDRTKSDPKTLSKYLNPFDQDAAANDSSEKTNGEIAKSVKEQLAEKTIYSPSKSKSAPEEGFDINLPKVHPLSPRSLNRSNDVFESMNSAVIMEVKPRIEAFITDGEYGLALKAIDEAIKRFQEEPELIQVKIRILERMRRYVEAAELKHNLKSGISSGTKPPVRRQDIIIGETDDPEGFSASHAPPANLSKSEEAKSDDDSAEEFPHAEISDYPEITDEVKHENSDDSGHQHANADSDITQSDVNSDEVTEDPDFPKSELTPISGFEPDTETTPKIDDFDSLPTEEESLEHNENDRSTPDDISISEVDAADDSESEDVTNADYSDVDTAKPTDIISTISEQKADSRATSKVRISIIIPTCADGKSLLESALISLARFADFPDRELIVIDNASLDETYAYLDQLRKDNFMQIRVLTNSENAGFGRSINQALDVARGEYVFVMHNDVTLVSDAPGDMADLLDSNDSISLIGPVSNVTTVDMQRLKKPATILAQIQEVDLIDSYCMMFRKKSQYRFDERYELAYFEDVDFCTTITSRGESIAVAEGVFVEHLGGATTGVIGLSPYDRFYWKNLMKFNAKWKVAPTMPDYPDDVEAVYKLITISEIINPFFPEQDLLKKAYEILTSEVRNELVNTRHRYVHLAALIRLMMIVDMRDVLRDLEAQLNPETIDDQLIYELIDFYYRKHIYSRCQKYLNLLPETKKSFPYKMLELRILMGDKKLEEASLMVSRLIDEVPTHPELHKITADIHNLLGNKTEAANFYALAHQLNPYNYVARREYIL